MATLATALALSPVEPAHAHVDVQPGLVAQGEVAELRVELPQLRPGPPPRRLALRGAGVQLLDSRLLGRSGSESRWLLRVRVDAAAGPLRLTLRAVHADGGTVDVPVALTVVPAADPQERSFPWRLAIVGVAVAACLAVSLIRLARRKAW